MILQGIKCRGQYCTGIEVSAPKYLDPALASCICIFSVIKLLFDLIHISCFLYVITKCHYQANYNLQDRCNKPSAAKASIVINLIICPVLTLYLLVTYMSNIYPKSLFGYTNYKYNKLVSYLNLEVDSSQ
jgi:hypothetical protein